MIRIVTDSTADLTPDLVKLHGLTVVPLYVRFGEKVYRDGIDLTRQEFLAKLASAREPPKTAQPTPGDFLAVFAPFIEAGEGVCYIGISSDLSGTHASAELAKKQLGDVPLELVDSRNLSMGIGLLAVKAAGLAAAGTPLREMAEELRRTAPLLRTAFVVNSLEYLYKGGRLNAFQAAIGGILNIHPLIAVKDGRLTAAEKIRGQRQRAMDRLFEYCLDDPSRADPAMIAVTHCGCPEDAEALADRIRRAVIGARVVVTEAGAVIASHCGPGTVGILYIARSLSE